GEKTRAWLEVGSKKITLANVKASKYIAVFRLPTELGPGSYKLWLHNGFGGGVYVPAGRYRISGGFIMPPRTVLKGEKRETVTLFTPDETPDFSCVIVGSGDFTVEDLTIVSRTARAMICCPQGPPSVGPAGSFV